MVWQIKPRVRLDRNGNAFVRCARSYPTYTRRIKPGKEYVVVRSGNNYHITHNFVMVYDDLQRCRMYPLDTFET